jgi:hypothetical protein
MAKKEDSEETVPLEDVVMSNVFYSGGYPQPP